MNGLLGYVPTPLRKLLRGLRRNARRQRLESGRHYSRVELATQFAGLGIATGDTVLVHSALSKIGYVDGGPQVVIDALFDAVGAGGTLVFPTFPFDTYVAEYLARNPDFDVATTPSRMGRITEVFRNRPDAIRSLHPTHPVSAVGPKAGYLTEAHHLGPTTFGIHSPFFRLAEVRGKILLLGVDFHSMTNLHVVEDTTDSFPYRVYRSEPARTTLRDSEGCVRVLEVPVHDPELSRLRDCNRMEKPFADRGVLRQGAIGAATARLMAADGVLSAMKDLAQAGFTMYDDRRVPEAFRRRGPTRPEIQSQATPRQD